MELHLTMSRAALSAVLMKLSTEHTHIGHSQILSTPKDSGLCHPTVPLWIKSRLSSLTYPLL